MMDIVKDYLNQLKNQFHPDDKSPFQQRLSSKSEPFHGRNPQARAALRDPNGSETSTSAP
jgi:hypothetical protein